MEVGKSTSVSLTNDPSSRGSLTDLEIRETVKQMEYRTPIMGGVLGIGVRWGGVVS